MSIPIRSTVPILLAMTLLATAGAVGAEGEPQLLSEHTDWKAYVIEGSSGKICYAASAPLESAPAMADRKPVWVTVTHRPADDVANELGVIAGYDYQPGSAVHVLVDTRKYELFTQGDGAWLRTAEEETQMVDDMRKGRRMSVVGVSNDGVTTTDKFSLLGFTAAHRAMSQACP